MVLQSSQERVALAGGDGAPNPSRRRRPTSPAPLLPRRRLSGPPDVRVAYGEGGGGAILFLPADLGGRDRPAPRWSAWSSGGNGDFKLRIRRLRDGGTLWGVGGGAVEAGVGGGG
jgi:hypothetical protein